jgi:hypothetical protein
LTERETIFNKKLINRIWKNSLSGALITNLSCAFLHRLETYLDFIPYHIHWVHFHKLYMLKKHVIIWSSMNMSELKYYFSYEKPCYITIKFGIHQFLWKDIYEIARHDMSLVHTFFSIYTHKFLGKTIYEHFQWYFLSIYSCET